MDLDQLSDYIIKYISLYRSEYEKFTSTPPEGAGYPRISVSPFISAKEFDVFLANNGVVISEVKEEPQHAWFVAGGPAIKVDTEPTSTPEHIIDTLKENNIKGNIGIYRCVAKDYIPTRIWRGRIKNISESRALTHEKLNITLNLTLVKTDLRDLVSSLTFGALGIIIDNYIINKELNLGEPTIIQKFGFFPADLNSRRFFNYLEIYNYSDEIGWSTRNIKLRISNDLRRDFARALSISADEKVHGTLTLGSLNNWIENYTNRLSKLEKAINEFKGILLFQSDDKEETFHKLIENNPILLDVYGSCISKPQLHYPVDHKSPIGKKYLEPDFIVCYPDQSYKLIELERASKRVATVQGHPRAEVSQAAYQIAEWTDFISEHYNEIRNDYPGINSKCKTCIIISRSQQEKFSNIEDMNRYKGQLIRQFRVDEIITYDDLYERVCNAYTTLTGLSPSI
ncbi:hypothetical protein HCH_02362 [Hahella chejuensis KCTC 2396]|uniref:Shedu protein SduA C-terminal domain-containing protein n=1 Tax=Hahella chejuensis (strain KCTC 2396) TaxID=349521 RepID=Q2SJJ1_HAHCH|nr:Shedu immune nuclease family protein [Hahella chejuensis]ABC29183.1 hypothetical protein HCH_02362 [Hahella chejuensis KCTC 2396]